MLPLARKTPTQSAPSLEAALADHGPAVWGLCRRCCPDPDDAFQEIWARIFGALPAFDPQGAATLRTWILTIAHRHLVDRHRRRVVRGTVVEIGDLQADSASPDEALDSARGRQRLEAALTILPEDQRRVILLHHLHGVELTELATSEGCAVGTIKSRLHRGRARLAELLGGKR